MKRERAPLALQAKMERNRPTTVGAGWALGGRVKLKEIEKYTNTVPSHEPRGGAFPHTRAHAPVGITRARPQRCTKLPLLNLCMWAVAGSPLVRISLDALASVLSPCLHVSRRYSYPIAMHANILVLRVQRDGQVLVAGPWTLLIRAATVL